MDACSVGLPIYLMYFIPKIFRIPMMDRRRQKRPDDFPVSHSQEPSIGAVYTALNDTETVSVYLLRELVILRIESLFVKTADFLETVFFHHHEHSCRKRFVKAGEALGCIIQNEKQVIHKFTLSAQDVGCYAMEVFASH